jgi:hypothetical protein
VLGCADDAVSPSRVACNCQNSALNFNFIAWWLQVLSLWLHETSRVFADRLTCQEDHTWFR